MVHTGDPTSDRPQRTELSVAFGGASVAFWFCCPFWLVVWMVALPVGLTGLVRGAIEYRAASRQGMSRTKSLIGLVLSSIGTAAAVAYMIFIFTHPYLDIQE